MASDSKHKVNVNPTQASHDVKSVRALDDEGSSRISTKRKREHAKSMGSTKLKKNKATVNLAKSMLLFLWAAQLSNYLLAYEASEKSRGPSTNKNTTLAINSWKRNYSFSWVLFSSLKGQLSSAPDSITFDHNPLLLEHMTLLEKVQSIRLLILSDHKTLKNKTFSQKFQFFLMDCLFLTI